VERGKGTTFQQWESRDENKDFYLIARRVFHGQFKKAANLCCFMERSTHVIQE